MKNKTTQETVYIPPEPEQLPELLRDLERFINTEDKLGPLIKMAIIHHQFESIHPFYDGNGRIINIIYLIQQRLLDIPVLYFVILTTIKTVTIAYCRVFETIIPGRSG